MIKHQYIFPIKSERLYFEPLGTKDIPAWQEFFEDNSNLAFVGITDPQAPYQEALKWIERQKKRYIDTGVGVLGAYLKDSGKLIGNCGLIWRENILGEDVFEIGYSVIPAYWNKGIASEMAIRFRVYFEEHQLGSKVISIIAVKNYGSQKVAEKNGFLRGVEFKFNGALCLQYFKEY